MANFEFIEYISTVANDGAYVQLQEPEDSENDSDHEPRVLGEVDQVLEEDDNRATEEPSVASRRFWSDLAVRILIKVVLVNDGHSKLKQARTTNAKDVIWEHMVDQIKGHPQFGSLNELFRQRISGAECSCKYKELTEKYKTLADSAISETGRGASRNPSSRWDYFDLLKPILISDPIFHPVFIGDSGASSAGGSITTTSRTGRILRENIGVTGVARFEVIAEAVDRGNPTDNNNAVVNDEPAVPVDPKAPEASSAPDYVNALEYIMVMHQRMLEGLRAANEEFLTRVVGTAEQQTAKRAREDEEFEMLQNQERDRVRDRLRRIAREDLEDAERRRVNDALIQALQQSRNINN